jgi:DNA primase
MDVVRLHQAGIGYAVATLGTATTPEHLKRAFRLVSEIIFCFDGDKAGRAAAWRALGNALPEARAGRELKFLFLPEGEDPDTLVGKEGKAAFEARYATAQPLSEYLVAHLTDAIDVSHADGKARFVAEARPLLERVPGGPYRELLLDRLAAAIGVSAERFVTIVGPMSSAEAADHPHAGRSRTTRSAVSAGRSSQLRQALKILLHVPASATRISAADRGRLDEIADKGVEVLRELIDVLHGQPATTTAQMLERWRDTPIGERLDQLAVEPLVLDDEALLGNELASIVQNLAMEPLQAELSTLHEHAGARALSPAEAQRLRELLRLTRRS